MAIMDKLAAFGIADALSPPTLRGHAMACVALPTCGLAMAESERYMPSLIRKIEALAEKAGLAGEPITIRMTGCPNGCARPYVAEIAFTGRAPGKYNMYLGGGFHGQRLNRLHRENIDEERILEELGRVLPYYARERQAGERLGDFLVRVGYIRPVTNGRDFNS
jgi:sulfite reductase (NADPH) hemoprotein beta-component